MGREIKVACIQLSVGSDPEKNLPATLALIDEAVGAGARFVLTPEATNAIRPECNEQEGNQQEELEKNRYAYSVQSKTCDCDKDPHIKAMAEKAKTRGIWLMAGSLVLPDCGCDGEPCREQGSGHEKLHKKRNRQFLWNPRGELVSIYDKIHMFDVDIGDGQIYRESEHYHPGCKMKLTNTDAVLKHAVIGHSICYDLRFPVLFQKLAIAGAEILVVPAAFTEKTGAAHWESLLRARAIENGAFVLAAGQTGEHAGGRRTYGHSMIISPFGEILAEVPVQKETDSCIATCLIDLEQVRETRSMIPNLVNQRELSF